MTIKGSLQVSIAIVKVILAEVLSRQKLAQISISVFWRELWSKTV